MVVTMGESYMPCSVSYNPCYSHCNATTTPLQPYYKPCNNHCTPHRVATVVTTIVILLGTRVDGSVLVIESAFSVNLTSLTLELVLGKRRKVVAARAASILCERT